MTRASCDDALGWPALSQSSCLGLAPARARAALLVGGSYSGVCTLLPLLSGEGQERPRRSHAGSKGARPKLRKLSPLLDDRPFDAGWWRVPMKQWSMSARAERG
jgi:hypothetical protein